MSGFAQESTSRNKPVGLTGGIATGKSTVAEMFRQLGAIVLDADRIARDVLVRDSEPLRKLVERFGNVVIDPDGGLNRPAMLNTLLENPACMRDQLQILAPFILPAIDDRFQQTVRENPSVPVMIDAPLLFEYGRRERYDEIVLVAIPAYLQARRLAARSNRSLEWARRVVGLQYGIEDKIRWSDYVIDNSGSLENTRIQTRCIFQKLFSRSGSG